METTRNGDLAGTQRDQTSSLPRTKPSSRLCLSGGAAQGGGSQLFTLHESFSSDDSAPELVEDDRPESASSFDDDEYQYHITAEQLWDSFWQGNARIHSGQKRDGLRFSLREEDSAPACQLREYPAPRRHSDKVAADDVFSTEEHVCQRDWTAQIGPIVNYSLFPRPPKSPPRGPALANPFRPSPTSPANPPTLHPSKSTPHLPPAPTSPPPSPPRRSPARRRPPRPLLLDQPNTPHRKTSSADLDAPVSPKSRPPPKPKSATVAQLDLNRPLPPVPTGPLTNPEPQPASFFDDSDDENGSPGLAARIKGKFAHRRAISREDEYAGRGSVLARMLRRSRA